MNKNDSSSNLLLVKNCKRKAATTASLNLSRRQASCLKRVSSLLRKKNKLALSEDEKKFLKENSELVNQFYKRREKRAESLKRLTELEDSPELLEEKCLELAQAIHDADFLVVYTGAGISTSASIPDYRGPNGIWTRIQRGQDIGTHDLTIAEPTLTHMAVSLLYNKGIVRHVVSQNCDGLHLRSGLPKTALSEVHGNMYIEVCKRCKPAREYVRIFDVTENTSKFKHRTGRRCYRCGDPLVDTIVHFGERGKLRWPLNWQGACQAAKACDTILCLGSSLKVLRKYPWLWQMERPAKRRPKLFIINLQWTPKDKDATIKINGKCDTVMKHVMKYLGLEIPKYSKIDDPIFHMYTPLHSDELCTFSQTVISNNEPSYDELICAKSSSSISSVTASIAVASTSTSCIANTVPSYTSMTTSTTPNHTFSVNYCDNAKQLSTVVTKASSSSLCTTTSLVTTSLSADLKYSTSLLTSTTSNFNSIICSCVLSPSEKGKKMTEINETPYLKSTNIDLNMANSFSSPTFMNDSQCSQPLSTASNYIKSNLICSCTATSDLPHSSCECESYLNVNEKYFTNKVGSSEKNINNGGVKKEIKTEVKTEFDRKNDVAFSNVGNIYLSKSPVKNECLKDSKYKIFKHEYNIDNGYDKSNLKCKSDNKNGILFNCKVEINDEKNIASPIVGSDGHGINVNDSKRNTDDITEIKEEIYSDNYESNCFNVSIKETDNNKPLTGTKCLGLTNDTKLETNYENKLDWNLCTSMDYNLKFVKDTELNNRECVVNSNVKTKIINNIFSCQVKSSANSLEAASCSCDEMKPKLIIPISNKIDSVFDPMQSNLPEKEHSMVEPKLNFSLNSNDSLKEIGSQAFYGTGLCIRSVPVNCSENRDDECISIEEDTDNSLQFDLMGTDAEEILEKINEKLISTSNKNGHTDYIQTDDLIKQNDTNPQRNENFSTNLSHCGGKNTLIEEVHKAETVTQTSQKESLSELIAPVNISLQNEYSLEVKEKVANTALNNFEIPSSLLPSPTEVLNGADQGSFLLHTEIVNGVIQFPNFNSEPTNNKGKEEDKDDHDVSKLKDLKSEATNIEEKEDTDNWNVSKRKSLNSEDLGEIWCQSFLKTPVKIALPAQKLDDEVKRLWFWGFDSSPNEEASPPKRLTRSSCRRVKNKCNCRMDNPRLCQRRQESSKVIVHEEGMLKVRESIKRRRANNYIKFEPIFEVRLKNLTYKKVKIKKPSKCWYEESDSGEEDKEIDIAQDEVNEIRTDEKKVVPGWYGKGYKKGFKRRRQYLRNNSNLPP